MSATSTHNSSSGIAGIPIVRWIFSSIGKKSIVAVSGLLLIGFLAVHMLGNFTLFFGQNALNIYAEKLQSLGPLLWVARLVLLSIFVAHIFFTILLVIENRAAGGSKYVHPDSVPSTIFAKTMKYTGLIVLAFVIFHLAHFTLGWVQPSAFHLLDPEGRYDVYTMVILGFQNVPISLFYILSVTLLTFHLSHGIGSLFQTFGITNKKLRPVFERGGMVVAWFLWAGYVSLPLSVLLNLVKLPA